MSGAKNDDAAGPSEVGAPPVEPSSSAVPIVAIGASAGGVEAMRSLLAALPPHTGLAFVVIMHLDPERPSHLASVLAHATSMPVVEVADGMRAAADRVHVIPFSSDVGIDESGLRLRERLLSGHLHLPIDRFFEELAAVQGPRCVGVVLSGSGADGTEGLRAIKAAGGITFVQDPESAQFRSMPDSASATGYVDVSLPPRALAAELARLAAHSYFASGAGARAGAVSESDGDVAEVLTLLRRQAQLDFSTYKRPTVVRRIARRMALRRVETPEAYAAIMREDPAEARALAEDLLIHVTSFFRDPRAFEALSEQVLEGIVRRKPEGSAIRLWSPGCATGEELFSLVICLRELLEKERRTLEIKAFGSDLSARAIEVARAAVYGEPALRGVSPERLERFFDRVEGGYRVGREVRESCIFVKHDLTREPPFAKLDLVSCRNVLIYFGTELQRRVLTTLHRSLEKPGWLLLGESEGVTGVSELFEPVDRAHRIFARKGESSPITYALSVGPDPERRLVAAARPERREANREVRQRAEHHLLSRYAPAAVIVDDALSIVHFVGRTGRFLTPPPGRPQTDVLRMAREELVGHLHEALESARASSRVVRRENLQVTEDGETTRVDLEVVPLPPMTPEDRLFFLVVFEEPAAKGTEKAAAAPPSAPSAESPSLPDETRWLERELLATRDYLRSLIQEHESTADELAATNEELVAANEELQTTVEELESAKEELQSTNEELGTVNDELRSRNLALDEVAADLVNVLESVEIPILIVDAALRVRRLTPTANLVAKVIPSDVGRSIDDVKFEVEVGDLSGRIRTCLQTNRPHEVEVRSHHGRWYRLKIRPYRSAAQRLEGAILSFVDVGSLRRAVNEAERVRDFAARVVDTVPTPLVVLDAACRVVSANAAYHAAFTTTPAELDGRSFFELGARAFDVPALHVAVDECLASSKAFRDVELDLPALAGGRSYSIAGLPIPPGSGPSTMLLAIADVSRQRVHESERARLLASEREARLEAQRANHAKDMFLATLSHELRTPLNTILLGAQLLRKQASSPETERASSAIERAALSQARLIEDLLDVSRIVSGKLSLELQVVELAPVVRTAVDLARGAAEAKGVVLTIEEGPEVGSVLGDPSRLQQVVANLLTNAIKFTAKGGHVEVRVEKREDHGHVTVRDDGIGIEAEVIPQLFERFVQADSSVTRSQGGLGLGLAIVRHLVAVHGGEVRARSEGLGRGSTFEVIVPLVPPGTMPPPRSEASGQATSGSLEGLRVVVIDDDDDTREGLAAMLRQMGVDVRAASSAAEGLEVVGEVRPHAVLCDVAMPGEDGYAFVRKLRARPAEDGGRTPAAALTALASPADRAEALAAGFQMHVAKPIDTGRLASVILSLASRR